MPADSKRSPSTSIPNKASSSRQPRPSGPVTTSTSETTLGVSSFSASPSQTSGASQTSPATSPPQSSPAAARLRRVASTATLRSVRSVRAPSLSPSITPSSISRINAPATASVSTSPISAGTSAASPSATSLAFSRSKSSHRRRSSQGPVASSPVLAATRQWSQSTQTPVSENGTAQSHSNPDTSEVAMKRKASDAEPIEPAQNGSTEKVVQAEEASARAKSARPRTWFGLLGGAAEAENTEADGRLPTAPEEDISADEAAFRASLGLLSGMSADTSGGHGADQQTAEDHDEATSAAGTLRALRDSGAEATLTQMSKLSRKALPSRASWFPWGADRVADEKTGASQSEDAPPTGTAPMEAGEPPQAAESAETVSQPTPAKVAPPQSQHVAPTQASTADAQSTWRWSRWRGQASAEPVSEHTAEGAIPSADVSHQLPVAATSDVAPAQDQSGEEAAAVPQARSVPYTSYLASWVPTWKGGSMTNSLPVGHAKEHSAESTTASEPISGASTSQRTPAEQVKADALARDSEAPTTPEAAISAVVSPSTAILNSATRSSWVNFFSSRSSNPPRMLLQDGPEVMDLDDEEPNSAVVPSTAQMEDKVQASSKLSYTPRVLKVAAQKSTPAASVKAPSGPATPVRPSTPQPEAPRNDPEPPSSRPSTPLTRNQKVVKAVKKAAASTSAVNAKGKTIPAPVPNLVLPTFEDTFARPPRSVAPRMSVLERTLAAVNSYLFSASNPSETARLRQPARKRHAASRSQESVTLTQTDEGFDVDEVAQRLPRCWKVMGNKEQVASKGCNGVRRVVVIGVHGWFAAGVIKTIMGEPTGTSVKFATEMASAVRRHLKEADMELNPEAVTVIPLQGDGKVADRVNKLFAELLSKPQWVKDLADADAVFVAAHSQGAIVATHLIARLVEQKQVAARAKIALLAMCGIHHGPFAHLRTTVVNSFFNYFETKAATELFEFQSSTTPVSEQYMAALRIVLDAGVKVVYVGSVDDQVVPLYSALNTSCSHPSILRALYIDGNSFPRTDFLINLLVFCAAVRNAGLADHDLLTLLSASVAGSLYAGLGHSLLYDEAGVYDLAVRYLFETTHPRSTPTMDSGETRPPALRAEPFTAQHHNPYNLPWAARGLLEDPVVRSIFGADIGKLLSDYTEWTPVSKTLKDVQWRLEPMRSIKRPLPPPQAEQGAAPSAPSGSKL